MPRVGSSRLVACLPLLGFAATYVTLRSGFPGLYVWPVHLAAPLVVAVVLAGLLRGSLPGPWIASGNFGPAERALALLVTAVSALVFAVWVWAAEPDIQAPRALARTPFALQLLGGLGFAAANAALEELVFRGMALTELRRLMRSRWVPVLLQALVFGLMHHGGTSIPEGLHGVAMTFVYGLALGALAVLAEGIRASWAAHFVADILVFGVLLTSA